MGSTTHFEIIIVLKENRVPCWENQGEKKRKEKKKEEKETKVRQGDKKDRKQQKEKGEKKHVLPIKL